MSKVANDLKAILLFIKSKYSEVVIDIDDEEKIVDVIKDDLLTKYSHKLDEYEEEIIELKRQNMILKKKNKQSRERLYRKWSIF